MTDIVRHRGKSWQLIKFMVIDTKPQFFHLPFSPNMKIHLSWFSCCFLTFFVKQRQWGVVVLFTSANSWSCSPNRHLLSEMRPQIPDKLKRRHWGCRSQMESVHTLSSFYHHFIGFMKFLMKTLANKAWYADQDPVGISAVCALLKNGCTNIFQTLQHYQLSHCSNQQRLQEER